MNESGLRAFWSLHMAYYYHHLSLIGEWQSGFDSYAFANQHQPHPRAGRELLRHGRLLPDRRDRQRPWHPQANAEL